MNLLRIIIVDDEKRIRSSLSNILQMYYPSATVVAEAEDVDSALEVIKLHKPDVVLLDIKMPGGSGFDLLKQLIPFSFKVIFITAFDEFAVQAFKFSALDYLLKPVNPDELVSALDRANEQLNSEQITLKLNAFISNMSGLTRETKKIVLNTQDTIHIINLVDIVRCEADRNYTRFVLANGKSILVSGSLKEYDDMLSPFGFCRSHHSHLVNLTYIDRFEKRDGGKLIMKDGSEALVASRRKDILLTALNKI